MSLEINFYSSGQIEATLYILPDESTFLFKNPTESSFKILLWIYEKIATSSAHENADARARENLKRLYIQVTFVYINYNEFSRFLTSSLGIKHIEYIICQILLIIEDYLPSSSYKVRFRYSTGLIPYTLLNVL